MSEITIPNAAEMIERTVKPVGGGAQVHVPKTWMGCRVAVVKLEDTHPDKIESVFVPWSPENYAKQFEKIKKESKDWGGDARTPQH